MEQIKSIVSLVQGAIENGATTVEEVHQDIASKPIELLKNIAPLANTADKVGKFQEQTIGSVYDTIRLVNAQVGEVARNLLDKAGK